MLAVGALGASPARAGWSRPFRLAAPALLDVIPAQTAFSTAGAAAVGFAVQDADDPAVSDAFAALRSPAGKLSPPRPIHGARQVLDLAYAGTGLELLVGTSPAEAPCCSSVQAFGPARGAGFGPAFTLVQGLAGATAGRLISLPGRLLAAIASERGVWVAQSARGQFPGAHRLTSSRALPETLDATSLPGGHSIVAWTARNGSGDAFGPRRIFISRGSLLRAPRASRTGITVRTGHRIDELALARGATAPSLAWIESWYDKLGFYHSQAVLADLLGQVRERPISSAGELASGLVFAADANGDQALTWKACASTDACAVRAALRPASGRFTRTQQLGAIDASQIPTVTISPAGAALLGWIHDGHVIGAPARAGASRFGSPHTVSATNFGADLAMAFGPAGQALATWTQGTLAQSVVGAVYRDR